MGYRKRQRSSTLTGPERDDTAAVEHRAADRWTAAAGSACHGVPMPLIDRLLLFLVMLSDLGGIVAVAAAVAFGEWIGGSRFQETALIVWLMINLVAAASMTVAAHNGTLVVRNWPGPRHRFPKHDIVEVRVEAFRLVPRPRWSIVGHKAPAMLVIVDRAGKSTPVKASARVRQNSRDALATELRPFIPREARSIYRTAETADRLE